MWSLVREIGWSANDKFRRQTLWGRDITIFLFVGGIENVFFWIFFYICVIFSRGDQGLTGEALGGWSDRKDRLAISCFNFETKKNKNALQKWSSLGLHFWKVVKKWFYWPKREKHDCRGKIMGSKTPFVIQFTAVPRL